MIIMRAKPKAPTIGVGFPGEQSDGSYSWQPFCNFGTFMSIDPGLDGTGWAVWRLESFTQECDPIASGSISPPDRGNLPWWEVANRIADNLLHLRIQYDGAVGGYVEQPAFLEGDKGQMVARRGDLVKLTTMFGMIAGKVFPHLTHFFAPVPIVKWKGQLPKEVCNDRVRKRLKKHKPSTNTTHELDAIGIGMYVKGFFG